MFALAIALTAAGHLGSFSFFFLNIQTEYFPLSKFYSCNEMPLRQRDDPEK